MPAMPVDTGSVVHVVADENDRAAPELHGQIQCLKARIAAVPNLAKLMDDNLVAAHVYSDGPHAPLALPDISAEFQALVIGQAARRAPPIIVAGVVEIRPRSQLPRVVDRDYFAAAARFL